MGYEGRGYFGKIWNQSKNVHERYKETFIYILSVLYKVHWNFIGTICSGTIYWYYIYAIYIVVS